MKDDRKSVIRPTGSSTPVVRTPASARAALEAALAGRRGATPGGVSKALVARAGDGAVRRAPLAAAASSSRKPRMVFAIDATASREAAWSAARETTDALFSAAAPGAIEVALAVHSGGEVSRFGAFRSDMGSLRDEAASVRCRAGETRMLDVVEMTLRHDGVRALVYVGDVFEEERARAMELADALRLRSVKLVVMHDVSGGGARDGDFFAAMAARTGGCVLPFDTSSTGVLRDLLGSLSAYVAGGLPSLRARSVSSPGARLLLGQLKS